MPSYIIMAKKLTLNIDSDLIDFAHEYSEKTNQSISNIISNYLAELKGREKTTSLPRKTSLLYGTLAGKLSVKKRNRKK